MVLVDTSAWIEVFRRPQRCVIEEVVEFDEIVTCLPVVQEVLQGFDDGRGVPDRRATRCGAANRRVPLGAGVFLEGVDLYRRARRAGLTMRSGVDCLIAACAIRHDLTVLHGDRDYPALARRSRHFAAVNNLTR